MKPLEGFAAGVGEDNNPRRAVLLTAAIALITIALGDLDVIAPIISMFFLASFGMINYATYSESRSANTSFRPTFRFFSWQLSLLGTLACLGTILAINPIAGALAGLSIFLLYRYLERSVTQARWADSSAGFHWAQVRGGVRALAGSRTGAREWRPCTVAFVPRDLVRRQRLIEVAGWLEGAAGITTAVRIVPGIGAVARRHAARVRAELASELSLAKSTAYGRVLVASDVEAGVAAVLQAHGLGAIEANLALFSWYQGIGRAEALVTDYTSLFQTGVRHKCNTAVVHAPDRAWGLLPEEGDPHAMIGVWWSGNESGELLTLLAWLCTRTPRWSAAEIRIVVEDGGLSEVQQLVEEARIPARVVRTLSPEDFVSFAASCSITLAPLRLRRSSSLGPGNVDIAGWLTSRRWYCLFRRRRRYAWTSSQTRGLLPPWPRPRTGPPRPPSEPRSWTARRGPSWSRPS